ncbi:MAG: hypothetical protein JWN20_430 [Jatrophihabitantaceae bacterium]|nr:hypothetical protein [Jatrophihabitantaceae bacterium]
MLFTLFRGPCGPDTAATVRRSLVELGALAGVSVAVAEDLALVLTEMVNNAVSAGAGAIHVALTEPPPHLQVHVTDDADGVPVLGRDGRHPRPRARNHPGHRRQVGLHHRHRLEDRLGPVPRLTRALQPFECSSLRPARGQARAPSTARSHGVTADTPQAWPFGYRSCSGSSWSRRSSAVSVRGGRSSGISRASSALTSSAVTTPRTSTDWPGERPALGLSDDD